MIFHKVIWTQDYQLDDRMMALSKEILNLLLLKLAELNPTDNLEKLNWLIREYKEGSFSIAKDNQMVKNLLINQQKFSNLIPEKDLTHYSVEELQKELRVFNRVPQHASVSKKAYKHWYQKELFHSNKAMVLYENASTKTKAIQLNHFDAVKYYAKSTKWCIKDRSAFECYLAEGGLYLISSPKGKYLLFLAQKAETLWTTDFRVEFANTDNDFIDSSLENLSYVGLMPKDSEMGAVLSELIIWNSLHRGIPLINYPTATLFDDKAVKQVQCLTRNLYVPPLGFSQNAEDALKIVQTLENISRQFEPLEQDFLLHHWCPPEKMLKALYIKSPEAKEFYNYQDSE